MEIEEALFTALFSDFGDGPDDNAESVSCSRKPRPARTKKGRRRAQRACQVCNSRKVRCDAVQLGTTCTNCRLDGLTCVLRDRRKISSVYQQASEQSPPVMTPRLTASSDGRPSSSTVPDTVDSDSFRDIPYEAEYTMAPLSDHQPVFPGCVVTLYSYFDFLNGESFSHLEPDDFQILELKGCFHVPSKPYLDQFVQQYFLHVHPVLPILDERRFWELYLPGEKERGQTPGDGIPLLVFRAMMFASCGFVSAETIGALGYKNSLEARTSLYRQAKLLHDLETMSQPIAIAQSALLLSFYHSEREPVANTSWLRIAIQFAMFEKAHLFMQMRESLSRGKYLCMKRLWWSVLHRDRVLSLGFRRPLQVSSDLFDPSQDPLCETDLEPEFTYSCVYSAGVKRALARVLISQVNLTVVLTDVIALIYPVRNDHHFDDPDRNTTRGLPDKLQDCRRGLSEWFVTSKQITRDTTHQAVMLFQKLSQIYYHSARAALCQFESLMLFGRKDVFHESALLRLQEIGIELHSAVVSISDKVRELMELNMAQYLPVSILAHIALPLVLETINQRTNSGTSKSGRERCQRYHNLVKFFSTRYDTPQLRKIIARGILPSKDDCQIVASKPGNQEDFEGWLRVFLSQPRQYLCNALAIDIALSTGRYPTSDELPGNLLINSQKEVPEVVAPEETIVELGKAHTPPSFAALSSTPGSVASSPSCVEAKQMNIDYSDLSDGLDCGNKLEETYWDKYTFEGIMDVLVETGLLL